MVSTCTFMTIGILSCRQRRNHTGCIFHQEEKIVIESTSTFFTYFPLFRHWPSKVARRTDVHFFLANFLGMATSHFFLYYIMIDYITICKNGKIDSLALFWRKKNDFLTHINKLDFDSLTLWLVNNYALTNIVFSLSKLSDITN